MESPDLELLISYLRKRPTCLSLVQCFTVSPIKASLMRLSFQLKTLLVIQLKHYFETKLKSVQNSYRLQVFTPHKKITRSATRNLRTSKHWFGYLPWISSKKSYRASEISTQYKQECQTNKRKSVDLSDYYELLNETMIFLKFDSESTNWCNAKRLANIVIWISAFNLRIGQTTIDVVIQAAAEFRQTIRTTL
jgi:hypothetical protein